MGEGLVVYGATSEQIQAYYFFVLLAFAYQIIKNRRHLFFIFIILLFYNGLASFAGKDIQNYYRILLTIISIFWLLKTKSLQLIRSRRIIYMSFILFSMTFLYTAYLNNDYLFIILSQYSRYFILFALFLVLLKFRDDHNFKLKIEKLVYEILNIQVLLTIIKLLLMGPRESLVGSIASQGGAIATSLPILGFMFIWIKRNGLLTVKDWIFVLGLLLIGAASVKRAIWFVFPIIFMALTFYIPKRKIPAKIIILSTLFVPIIFYIGIRLNPTLNRDHKIWGSFEWDYVITYAISYTFGNGGSHEDPVGRGGATIFMFNKLINNDLTKQDWIGNGLRYIYTTNYEEFKNLDLEISNKGSATGAFQTLISNGYLGVFTLVLFALSLLSKTRNRRLKYVFIGLFIWEYFLYTGILIRDIALSFLFTYCILLSDVEFGKLSTKNRTPGQKKI